MAGTPLAAKGTLNAYDLRRILRHQIGVISPDTFVTSEEFSQWAGSLRRADLLELDRSASLVAIEPKRTPKSDHMELLPPRYAALVCALTCDRTAKAYRDSLDTKDRTWVPPKGERAATSRRSVKNPVPRAGVACSPPNRNVPGQPVRRSSRSGPS